MVASSPSMSHPTTYPTLPQNSHLHLNEDPFRDPPLLHHHHHHQQCRSSFLAADIPADNTTTTNNANHPTQHPLNSPSLPSPGGSTPPSAPPLHRTSRYVFAALAVAFYASTILLTAAIVLVVRNATGSKNGRLRASGVIMGLIGGAGVLASGLTAWGMWRNEGRPRGATASMGIEERMRIDLELRRLVMKNRASSSAPALGSGPTLGLALMPSPLFAGRSRRRRRRRSGGGLGWTGRTISASGDHGNIVHENASIENGISITEIPEEKRRGSDQGRTTSALSPLSLPSPAITPHLSPTPDTQQEQQHRQPLPPPDQDLDQYIRPIPTPPATTTSNEHPHASIAWTHHLSLSTSSISTSSSSPSIPPPLQNPTPHHPSSPGRSLLHALAADMGSEDESTRQAKRKRGLEVARTWGAVDDSEEGEGKGGGTENEIENGKEWEKGNGNGNGNGRRWGRVWGRKRKEKG